MNTLRKETLIGKDYVRKWTLLEAAKEFTQNHVFAIQHLGANGKTWHDGKYAYWEDDGRGFNVSALLLGEGEQKDIDNAPGENSEGQKLALLVAAREEKRAEIEIPGYKVTAQLEQGSLLSEELVLYIAPNDRIKGTRFVLECDRETYQNAINHFGYLCVSPEKRNMFSQPSLIDDGGGNIYINGVRIDEKFKSIFSYNLTGKNLSNRDRNAISHGTINYEIWKQVLQHETRTDRIKKILSATNDSVIETYCVYTDLINPNVNIWKRASKELWGEKVCYASGSESDTKARYKKYKVIPTPSWSMMELLESLEIKSSEHIVPVKQKHDFVLLKELTEKEKGNIRRARNLIQKYYTNLWNLRYVEDLRDDAGNKINGECNYSEELIHLERDILSNFNELFQTLIHEAVHQVSRASDCTADFEREWARACLAFAMGCTRNR